MQEPPDWNKMAGVEAAAEKLAYHGPTPAEQAILRRIFKDFQGLSFTGKTVVAIFMATVIKLERHDQ